jgi:putative mRNA 3-end processing factor
VDADVLVVEATYGRPDYRFPPQDELDGRIVDWLADTDRAAFLFGYSLGRAQKLQWLARRATNRRLVVHDAVHDVNRVVAAATDLDFGATPVGDVDRIRPDDVVVAPSGARRGGRVARALDRLDAVTAGFSGWAVDESYRYRTGYDEAFVLTDHCDFDELVALVRAVDPERVYTHHGFADDLAAHLSTRHGYDAVSLKRGQARLDEF